MLKECTELLQSLPVLSVGLQDELERKVNHIRDLKKEVSFTTICKAKAGRS